jgi:hypothetical protein
MIPDQWPFTNTSETNCVGLTDGESIGKISAMFYQNSPAASSGRTHFPRKSLLFLASFLLLPLCVSTASSQSYTTEMVTGDTVSLTVKSRNGKVSIVAADDLQKKLTLEAKSTGAAVNPSDVTAVAKGNNINIDVKDRSDKDRIDLMVRIPVRSKVKVETEAGAVDVIGNLESAEVSSNTFMQTYPSTP